MFHYTRTLEKLGFADLNNADSLKELTFDDISDDRVKRELTLMKNIRLYNDYIAESQLIALYGGQLQNLVGQHQAKDSVGYEQAFQRAVSALKQYARTYDFNKYKDIKPITHLTNNINHELGKLVRENNSQKIVSMSGNLNENKNVMHSAESILLAQLGRKPTPNETLNFVKNDMGLGKNLTLDKINRIRHYETREYSGLAQIGSENAAGAESLTFEDIANKGKDIGTLVERTFTEDKLIEAIREFTDDKSERKFLMLFLGIGEFRSDAAKGDISGSASKMGIAYYPSRKAVNGFYKFCKDKGII